MTGIGRGYQPAENQGKLSDLKRVIEAGYISNSDLLAQGFKATFLSRYRLMVLRRVYAERNRVP